MSSEIFLALGVVATAVIFAAAYGAMLAFHDPKRPAWMNKGYADNVTVIVLVTVAIFNFAWMLYTLLSFHTDPLVAMFIVATVAILTAMALWRKMHMRERLDAARDGMSPFSELRHIRHRTHPRGHRPKGFGGGAVGTT